MDENWIVDTTSKFDKEYKRLQKKYPNAIESVDNLMSELETGHLVGDEYDGLGFDNSTKVYKVRVANTQANKGKSGGFRVIYYALIDDKYIIMLSIYSKSDTANVTQKEIKDIIKKLQG